MALCNSLASMWRILWKADSLSGHFLLILCCLFLKISARYYRRKTTKKWPLSEVPQKAITKGEIYLKNSLPKATIGNIDHKQFTHCIQIRTRNYKSKGKLQTP